MYDSKKSGARTVSHLRFGPEPIRAPYLISEADFIACHQFNFVEKVEMLEFAAPGATFLLNSPGAPKRYGINCPDRYNSRSLRRR